VIPEVSVRLEPLSSCSVPPLTDCAPLTVRLPLAPISRVLVLFSDV
jgi:hypothetical protein